MSSGRKANHNDMSNEMSKKCQVTKRNQVSQKMSRKEEKKKKSKRIYCRTGEVRVCDYFANTRTSIALANLAHAINYIHGNATHH